MSQPMSDVGYRDWPTPVLVTAAHVLRTLTPTAIATLTNLDDDTPPSQTAIADTINRDQSTVSDCLRSLTIDRADVSLVEKSGQFYHLTDTGADVLDLVTDPHWLGDGLDAVDWGSERDKERVGDRFAPLHDSRSIKPFLLLDSVALRSGIDGVHENLRSVAVDKTFYDVEIRLQKIDYSEPTDLQQIIKRLVERNAVISTGDYLKLTEKGLRLVGLFNQVAAVVAPQVEDGQSAESDDAPAVEDIALQMRRGRLATSYSLENADSELVDELHIYHRLKRIDVLDSPNDDWHSYRWLTVENTGTAPTNSILHKESGDTKITFEDMDLTAFLDNRDGQQLETKNLTDYDPAIEQKMAIYFPRPLPPGETITIYYEISWPNELAHYPEGELDQTISLTRYSQGVNELQFGVLDKADHVGVDCQKFVGEDDQRWECLSTPPEHIDAEQRSELEPIHGEGYSGHIYTIPSPVYPAYRIAYSLKESTVTM